MSKTYEANQQRSEAANQAFWSFMDAYAEAIGERPTKDDPETRAARKIAAEVFGYLLPYPVTDDDRATVAAMVEAIAERWTQDHERRDLFSEQAEYEQRAAELAAVEAAAPEALASEGNPEDAVNLIAYTAFADIHDGATPDTYDDNDMEQLERLMGYASEIVRRDGPAHGIQWASYQRCELEAFLGEPDDYDVDAIEAEATAYDYSTGRRYWTAFGGDLAAIAERHELYTYAPAI